MSSERGKIMASSCCVILVAATLIFSCVLVLCYRDSKKLDVDREGECLIPNINMEDITEAEVHGEGDVYDEIDPRSSFDYIINLCLSGNYEYNWFYIYKKLMEKITDMVIDPRCDYNDVEKYEEILQEFMKFHMNCEGDSHFKERGELDVIFKERKGRAYEDCK